MCIRDRLRNIHRLPGWFYSIIKMGSPKDTHTETERYGYLRQIVDKLNHTGNVRLVEHGAENLPEQDGFILFPNHQGLYDMLALIGSCPHPISIVIKKEAEKMVLVREVTVSYTHLLRDCFKECDRRSHLLFRG